MYNTQIKKTARCERSFYSNLQKYPDKFGDAKRDMTTSSSGGHNFDPV